MADVKKGGGTGIWGYETPGFTVHEKPACRNNLKNIFVGWHENKIDNK